MEMFPDELVHLVRRSGTLCLNVVSPGWDDARGYLFDETTMTLYFPVSLKYAPPEPATCQVVIWGQPRVVATGELLPATSDDDLAVQVALAESNGTPSDKIALMLLDQRNRKPRKTRRKLVLQHLRLAEE